MSEPTVVVGRITRAHGVRGEVAVLVLSEVPERFAAGSVVLLEDGRPLTVESSRPHRGRLLVKFREVPDRSGAEALRSKVLVVPESASPELPEGSWWDHQLVGCEVVTESGRSLGELREVIHTPANDVWSAIAGGTETLVPALRDVVVSVDVTARRIVVREVPGLVAPQERDG
ncbi:MAG TPA: ribosome maturation factor RimM [Actinomycetota bacterium]|nr:ribosome maturation factor RimM [Actinomycetota bacterium]